MSPASANNQYWLLNSISGWRESAPFESPLQSDGVLSLQLNDDKSLSLQTLPGEAEVFVPDPTGLAACPAALTHDACDRTYVLDAASNRVVSIDASENTWPISDFGGLGSQPRQFDAPRGLAMVRGALVVSDTGNHRVQVFSPPPYALLQLWGRDGGTAGNGTKEFRWPWGVASDHCGNIYVADRGNGRIQKIALDGTWLATIGAGALSDPTELAVSPLGTLAVIDGTVHSTGGAVHLFKSGETASTILSGVDRPRAVAFDSAANLYIGTATGLVFHFTPDAKSPDGYALVGSTATGLDATVVSMIWTAGSGLLGIFQDNASLVRRLWTISTDGSRATTGQYTTISIDSGIEDCSWDRVTLIGTVPDGSAVKVEYFTSPVAVDGANPTAIPVSNPNDGPPYTFVGDSVDPTSNTPSSSAPTSSSSSCANTADQALTCLIQADPGRYLRLRFTFTSNGESTPRISAIKVFFPRQSYLQYLPAVFQQDDESRDFLDRFLSIFQATFDDFDSRIDSMWRLFDPDSVPAKYFDWLAAWLQLPTDPTWPMAKKRAMLKKAAADYRQRGTVAGILQAIKDYAGVGDGVALVEHFRLRNWPLLPIGAQLGGDARLWSRQFYQRLQVATFSQVGAFRLTDRPEPAAEASDWGANEFSVFFPADPYDAQGASAKVSAVVEREKPAHAQANYVPVLPRFRVGVQATVGVDTSIGGYTHIVLGSLSRLGYDAILGCSPQQRDLEKLGATVQPIAGVNTRLF
ncbi:MAG TPA: phage tail protein [Gemmataceae bacterium]|jgi:phage tail-like protein|nr:phage tail protein [Gemmataceae bacterium]